MKNEFENAPPRRPTPDEYRAARLRAGCEATRAVRRTLLVVALLAGLYYCFLTATQKKGPPQPPIDAATTAVESPASADAAP